MRSVACESLCNSLIRARVRSALARYCSETPGLMLAGSWLYDEAHLCGAGGSLQSYSDVDLVVDDLPDHGDKLRLKIMADLAGVGYRPVHISIRRVVDVRKAYSASSLATQDDRLAFMRFWAAIGGFELAILMRRLGPCSLPTVVDYGMVKILFSMFRNVALLSGHVVHSCQGVAEWVLARSGSIDLTPALQVKYGWPCPVEDFGRLVWSGTGLAFKLGGLNRDPCLDRFIRYLPEVSQGGEVRSYIEAFARSNIYGESAAKVLEYEIAKFAGLFMNVSDAR